MNKGTSAGYTLIELLVAFVLLLIILNGFMYGLALYLDYELRSRVKNEASRMLKDITGYLESISYDHASALNVPTVFRGKKCVQITTNPGPPPTTENLCEFEYSDPYASKILDRDSDNIPDFYDPYYGKNSNFKTNPRSVAGWLTVYPSSSGNSCNLATVNFSCVRKVAGIEIYAGVTASQIVDYYWDPSGSVRSRELGRAFGVTVWYFEPKTDRFISIKSLVFKERE